MMKQWTLVGLASLFANKFFVIVKLYLMMVSSTSISSNFIDSLDFDLEMDTVCSLYSAVSLSARKWFKYPTDSDCSYHHPACPVSVKPAKLTRNYREWIVRSWRWSRWRRWGSTRQRRPGGRRTSGRWCSASWWDSGHEGVELTGRNRHLQL